MSPHEPTDTLRTGPPGPAPQFLGTGPCTHCGYDMRSNSIDDPCPQCGRPVLDSSPKWPLSDDTPAGLRIRRMDAD